MFETPVRGAPAVGREVTDAMMEAGARALAEYEGTSPAGLMRAVLTAALNASPAALRAAPGAVAAGDGVEAALAAYEDAVHEYEDAPDDAAWQKREDARDALRRLFAAERARAEAAERRAEEAHTLLRRAYDALGRPDGAAEGLSLLNHAMNTTAPRAGGHTNVTTEI